MLGVRRAMGRNYSTRIDEEKRTAVSRGRIRVDYGMLNGIAMTTSNRTQLGVWTIVSRTCDAQRATRVRLLITLSYIVNGHI